MSRSENLVILIGNLVADPEFKEFDNGGSVANFRIATSRHWRDRESGDRREKTTYHNIVAKNKLANIVNDYFSKGRQVYIKGYLDQRSFKHREHEIDIYVTEIIAEVATLLGNSPTSMVNNVQSGTGDAGSPVDIGKIDF